MSMRTENISFKYQRKHIFKSLNIQLKKHTITTIIGPNGSGKSTLLQILSRNLEPSEGIVYLDNQIISSLNRKTLARQLATVHQNNRAPEDFTVKEVVQCGRYSYQSILKKDIKQEEVIQHVLHQLELEDFQDKPISELSGGELQRVYIAMSLAQEPQYMLLDEPTTYLDLHYQYQVLDIISSLKENFNITIIMVLHDINQAIEYSDEILCIHNNQVVQGPPEEVVTESFISRVYNIDAKIIHDPECGMLICKRKGRASHENHH